MEDGRVKLKLNRSPIDVDVDVAFVAEGSRDDAELETKMRNIMEFFSDQRIEAIFKGRFRRLCSYRARLIVYGGMDADGVPQVKEFDFCQFPQQKDEFAAQLAEMSRYSNPDEKDAAVCGLTALQRAISSPWCSIEGNERRCRHIIVMFAGHAEDSAQAQNILQESGDQWEQMDYRAKRLVMFVASEAVWNGMYMWERTAETLGWKHMPYDDIKENLDYMTRTIG